MEVFDDLWSNSNVLVPHAVRAEVDSAQSVVEPRAHAAEHRMVLGVHGGAGLLLPQLPEGGCALLDHVAPTGIGRLRGQFVSQIRPPNCGEHRHQKLNADEARGHVRVVIVDDVVGQVTYHVPAVLARNQVQEERHSVGGLSAVRIVSRVGVKVGTVQCVFDLGGEFPIGRRFARIP